MSLNKGQLYLAWFLLVFCLMAIPVSLFTRFYRHTGLDDNTSDDKQFSGPSSLRNRILVVKISGMICDDDRKASLDYGSCAYAKKQLRKATKDSHIKAILLHIDSPGGTIATSQEIHHDIEILRDSGKPVVVSMGDVAASGGYYIACAANKIFACPGTLTGSIGVIMHLFNLETIEKKIGVAPMVIKSGIFKDIGSLDRPMTKEEHELLSSIIMDSYDQFVSAVAAGRKMDKAEVKKLADGRVYSGRQALKVKLVDTLGTYEDALAYLQKTVKDKYGLKHDLYVDEGRPWADYVKALLEGQLNLPSAKVDLFSTVLPESLQAKYSNQPLWLMQ